jgi:hypothetical protein
MYLFRNEGGIKRGGITKDIAKPSGMVESSLIADRVINQLHYVTVYSVYEVGFEKPRRYGEGY